jgi:broad specificity phosphatase PhoE
LAVDSPNDDLSRRGVVGPGTSIGIGQRSGSGSSGSRAPSEGEVSWSGPRSSASLADQLGRAGPGDFELVGRVGDADVGAAFPEYSVGSSKSYAREHQNEVSSISPVRVFVLARHGESALNATKVVNGDFTVDVRLTEKGRRESELLGQQVRNLPLELCVVSRFGRTQESAEIALAVREVPIEVEPLLDDVDVGDLEGASLDEYRAWKHGRARSERFPNGESLDEAAARYGRALESLLARPEQAVLVVTHEIPVRYTLNAAGWSPDLDRPHHDIENARPYMFAEEQLARAAARLARVEGAPSAHRE